MSISALFGSRIVLPSSSTGLATKTAPTSAGRRSGLVIECSSRPQKKATAHHRKTRPKKTQPWDVKRKPAVYPPLPPLPPDWSFVPADESSETVLVASTTQSIENP